MRYCLYFILCLAVFVLVACAQNPVTPTPISDSTSPEPEIPDADPTVTAIAAIIPTRNTVEKGPEWNQLTPIPLEATGELFEHDALRVANGGEALLDFGAKLWMHLFHDTELGVISIDAAPNAARWAEFEIFRCCVTGELSGENTKIVYRTPGGAEILISGTSYFIVYDPVRTTTIVGNFDGVVSVISAGSEISLQPGYSVTVPMNQPPNPPQPLELSISEIEEQMRSSGVMVATEFFSTATATPSDTPTPTDTITPSPSHTSTHTPTPTETPIPCARQLQVTTNAFCRRGPGTVYGDVTAFQEGMILELLAQNPGSQNKWWRVAIPNSNASCWVSGSLVRVEGVTSPECVPVEEPPPTPTYTPSPTPTISVTPTPSNLPPPAPQIISPSNSSEPDPTTLNWSAVSDSDGIAYFQWQLENLSTNQVFSGQTQQTSVTLNTSTNTTYRWRVRAVDNTNLVGQYSPWAQFNVPIP